MFIIPCDSHTSNEIGYTNTVLVNGTLTRYVKLWVAHAPGMPGTFSPPPQVADRDMHHSTCVTHVSWRMLGSITSGFLWSRCWGKRSQHSRRMHNPQFYVSGKRPMAEAVHAHLMLQSRLSKLHWRMNSSCWCPYLRISLLLGWNDCRRSL